MPLVWFHFNCYSQEKYHINKDLCNLRFIQIFSISLPSITIVDDIEELKFLNQWFLTLHIYHYQLKTKLIYKSMSNSSILHRKNVRTLINLILLAVVVLFHRMISLLIIVLVPYSPCSFAFLSIVCCFWSQPIMRETMCHFSRTYGFSRPTQIRPDQEQTITISILYP